MHKYDLLLEKMVENYCFNANQILNEIRSLELFKNNNYDIVNSEIAPLIRHLSCHSELDDLIIKRKAELNLNYCLPIIVIDSFFMSSIFYGDKNADNILQLVFMSNNPLNSMKSLISLWMKSNSSLDNSGEMMNRINQIMLSMKDGNKITPRHLKNDPFADHQIYHSITLKFLKAFSSEHLEVIRRSLDDLNVSFDSVFFNTSLNTTLPTKHPESLGFEFELNVNDSISLLIKRDAMALHCKDEVLDFSIQGDSCDMNKTLDMILKKLDFLDENYPSIRNSTLETLKTISINQFQLMNNQSSDNGNDQTSFVYEV